MTVNYSLGTIGIRALNAKIRAWPEAEQPAIREQVRADIMLWLDGDFY